MGWVLTFNILHSAQQKNIVQHFMNFKFNNSEFVTADNRTNTEDKYFHSNNERQPA